MSSKIPLKQELRLYKAAAPLSSLGSSTVVIKLNIGSSSLTADLMIQHFSLLFRLSFHLFIVVSSSLLLQSFHDRSTQFDGTDFQLLLRCTIVCLLSSHGKPLACTLGKQPATGPTANSIVLIYTAPDLRVGSKLLASTEDNSLLPSAITRTSLGFGRQLVIINNNTLQTKFVAALYEYCLYFIWMPVVSSATSQSGVSSPPHSFP